MHAQANYERPDFELEAYLVENGPHDKEGRKRPVIHAETSCVEQALGTYAPKHKGGINSFD